MDYDRFLHTETEKYLGNNEDEIFEQFLEECDGDEEQTSQKYEEYMDGVRAFKACPCKVCVC